ncbi:RNA polymerase, sigma-24 subunit, ECF subfamily [Beutenbergia cavernae DSM 12333]|uniref:RNA polymerase, sigma-24 subunit, ECF subfamily n=1 Tax=Beutenbergia cavernae (strain ATCC BAA-8 / DSM 12333 / CCUG 43141 / JCM 11478 / NBRC 16432 / NCIMB 13614 / HKI 0122) TaxID=471853 RepID=C5C5T8_BEUC1|nr:RNA polymerase sigma factor [Beutenbergia cavernae]ACQ82296.1 RNA polymerase, sigma-24 subunit, ECF subfamily [Beutenbergia cavernae DSM 12333]
MSNPPFAQVVERHGPTVLRVVRALLPPDQADDAWSETFLAALKAYPDLPGGANLEAWLVTIAHRKAIDAHRSRARRAVPAGGASDVVERLDAAGHVGTGHVGAPPGGWERDLWEALAELAPKQRTCVVHHYVGGLPYEEVAAIVGGTAAAARRAAADGVARLRRTYLEGAAS